MVWKRAIPRLTILVLAWLFVVGPVAGDAQTMRLSPEEREGYRVWLHNLETTVASRADRQGDETVARFPFGVIEGHEAARRDTTSLLAVARELNELEALPRILQEPARKTALHAITRARNHAHIAEFDTALVWYEIAARRDSAGAFTRELGPEAMAVAVATGDSVATTRRLLAMLGARDLTSRGTELTLAYRHLVASRDTANVDLLIAEVEQHVDFASAPGELIYWHAFALNWRERWDESLDHLAGLLARGGQSHGLTEAQRTWVLVAVADQLMITGHLGEAAPMYRALAGTDLAGARDWARCQAAAIDFLSGRYLEAGTVFEQLCDQREPLPWRAYACGMAQLSDEMERLRSKGRDHGAVAHFER
ncbi:hypothetical protein GF314_07475 [bacterium]|nr:hypothetical protein [bacterium]